MPARDGGGSIYEILGDIQVSVGSILAGGNVPIPFGTSSAELDEVYYFGVTISDIDGAIIPSANITAGTYTVTKMRAGVRTTTSPVASSKSNGRVYAQVEFNTDSYQIGDFYEVTFSGITVVDSTVTTEVPDKMIMGRITELPAIASTVVSISGGVGLLQGKADNISADTQILRSDLVAVDTVVDSILADTTAIKTKTDNLPANPAAVGSAMTLAADAVSTDAMSAGVVAEIQSGLATSAGQSVTDGKVDAVKTQTAAIEVDTQDIQSRLTTAQTDLTAIKGYTDILDDATNGNAAIKTAVNARSTPTDVLTQAKAALNTAVGAGQVPTAKSLYDILHKNGSYTYDKSTDSLEAIRDYLTAIQNGSTTLQALADKVDQQKIGRSTQSASTTMTGSEQTLYEQSSTVPWKFEGGRIDLSGLADTRSVTIRFYQKCKSGGTYRLQSTVVLTGAADAGLYEIPMQLPIGGTSYKAVLPGVWNTFGLKVTAQQTVAGAGNLTIDHEWMDSKS